MALKRELGLFSATMAGIGIIVGAGIYVLIGVAAGQAGNAVWMSFLISSLVAVFTGLSYAELCSLFPVDAGEYTYVNKAMGKMMSFITGYTVLFAGVVSGAAVALGFGGYISAMVGGTVTLWAVGVIAGLTFINYWGIKQSSTVNIVSTVLEIAALLLIVIFGFKFVGSVDLFDTSSGIPKILNTAALLFFAFIGFENLIKLSEETKNPRKTMPKAVILSIIFTTIIYVLVAIVAVSVIDWQVLGQSTAPLSEVARALWGSSAFFWLGVVALFSTGNTVLLIMLTTSRMLYGMGQSIPRLKLFTIVDKATKTPVYAVFAIGIVTLLFALIGNIGIVAEVNNFIIFFTFILVNLAVIILRYKMPAKKLCFRAPCSIGKFPVTPLLGVLTSLFLLFNLDKKVILAGIGIIVLGFVVYRLLGKKFKL